MTYTETYTDIYTAELPEKLRSGASLYDVREPEEYLEGHIPGAINLPLSVLVGREHEVTRPAVLVCLSGGRSAQAAHHLSRLGQGEVMNLVGGTLGWMREGREMSQGPQP